MSLSKSKCWYSNDCLHFLKCAVPLITFDRIFKNLPSSSHHCLPVWHVTLLPVETHLKIVSNSVFPFWKYFHLSKIAIAGKCGVYNCLCIHNLKLSILPLLAFCLIENFYLFLITNVNICDISLINLPLLMHLKPIDLFCL
jgi:hypothetical protein